MAQPEGDHRRSPLRAAAVREDEGGLTGGGDGPVAALAVEVGHVGGGEGVELVAVGAGGIEALETEAAQATVEAWQAILFAGQSKHVLDSAGEDLDDGEAHGFQAAPQGG